MKKQAVTPNPKRTTGRIYAETGDHSRTKQATKDECDINKIIKRHTDTGNLTHINPRAPQFGDYAYSGDLKQAMDSVQQANDRFAELPSAIRAAAHNSPTRFLAMLEDENGQHELAELGLTIDGYQPPLPMDQDEDGKSVPPKPSEKPAEGKSAKTT